MRGLVTLLHVEQPIVRDELGGEPFGEFERTGRKAMFKIVPATGAEYEQGLQMQSAVTHELKCAFFPGANSRMRLTAGEAAAPSRVFNVVSVVNHNEANRFLLWRCTENS